MSFEKINNEHVERIKERKQPVIDDLEAVFSNFNLEEPGEVDLDIALRKEERDSIKPDYYRKGEIDLFESWYRTYTFNEFRAIMQSIAERYLKRDKDNRIVDLDKSIYTITRLKEYEEKELFKNK